MNFLYAVINTSQWLDILNGIKSITEDNDSFIMIFEL